MRVKVAGPVRANKGQTVRLRASLPAGETSAIVEVFSAVGKVPPSPHIPAYMLQARSADNKPKVVQSTTMRLYKAKTTVEIEITADDDKTRFYLFHDIDVKGDPLVKARIVRDGSFKAFVVHACGWLRGRR